MGTYVYWVCSEQKSYFEGDEVGDNLKLPIRRASAAAYLLLRYGSWRGGKASLLSDDGDIPWWEDEHDWTDVTPEARKLLADFMDDDERAAREKTAALEAALRSPNALGLAWMDKYNKAEAQVLALKEALAGTRAALDDLTPTYSVGTAEGDGIGAGVTADGRLVTWVNGDVTEGGDPTEVFGRLADSFVEGLEAEREADE